MKLAEALQERADLNRRIQYLEERLINNCTTQEGEEPAEHPDELLKELEGSLSKLEVLASKINLTNSSTEIDGRTITELIARRDHLSRKIGVLRNVIRAASSSPARRGRSEIRIIRTVDVTELQKRTDDLSKELRLLNNELQQTNWTVELLE